MAELKKQNRQNPTTLRHKLENIKKLYGANKEKSYKTCVELSIDIFQDVFNYQIKQLLTAFPHDHIIEETGKPFWSGLKRAPSAIELDLNDPISLELIQAGANIYACMFNLPLEKDKKKVAEIASKIPLKPFVAKEGVKIETDDKKAAEQPAAPILSEDDEKEIEVLLGELTKYNIDAKNDPTAIEFEKDAPTNFHIEFMGGVSNLRVPVLSLRPATTRLKRSITSRSS